MKKFLMPVLLMSSFCVHSATALSNYQEVIHHFEAGEALKLQVKLDQCEGPTTLLTDILFTVDVNPAMKVRSTLKFSTTHFTRNNPKHPGQSIYEYLVYNLGDDNVLHITAQTIYPNNYEKIDSDMKFSCEMGKAAVFYASK
ncbi:VirK family protein [Legionella sp. W05-934-2]|jgi:hypothetical protein|uniref:VirK family protein n=1 Tax=Legionella sp. W05-934-2 TaxID=1198649 RepID=UPI0034638487